MADKTNSPVERLSVEQQEKIIHAACRLANLDGHISWVSDGEGNYTTWPERIAIQFGRPAPTPVKTSYMFCDTLDMCFFFIFGEKPAFAFSGYTTFGAKDANGGLMLAFAKANEVLRYMDSLMSKPSAETTAEATEKE